MNDTPSRLFAVLVLDNVDPSNMGKTIEVLHIAGEEVCAFLVFSVGRYGTPQRRELDCVDLASRVESLSAAGRFPRILD